MRPNQVCSLGVQNSAFSRWPHLVLDQVKPVGPWILFMLAAVPSRITWGNEGPIGSGGHIRTAGPQLMLHFSTLRKDAESQKRTFATPAALKNECA